MIVKSTNKTKSCKVSEISPWESRSWKFSETIADENIGFLNTSDLDHYLQTSPKFALVMASLFFIKFKALKNIHRENKNLDFHKT